MRNLLRIAILLVVLAGAGITAAHAQRVMKGVVYMDGKPAAGITVEVQKGGTMMTSFDGKYEVAASPKSSWIKFTYIDESKKVDLDESSPDVLDFAFTGSLPSEGGAETASTGVDLRTAEDLVKAKDENFMNEWSMYTEFYKQNDYKSAMPHLKKLVAQYPKASPNLYIQGAKMYEALIDATTTESERNKLIDEYMKLHDTRIKYMGDEGFVLGRKGAAWYDYKLHKTNGETPEDDELKQIHKTGYELLNKSIELQGNETEAPVLVLFMQSTVALYKLGELTKEKVVENYEKCSEIANSIINTSTEASVVESTRDKVLPYIEELFGKSGAADCDVLVKIYSAEFEKNQNDVDYVKTMLRRLSRAKCTESELFANATEKLYELEPSAEAAYNMARRALNRDDLEKAREYYQMAIDQETDNTLLATYYYERGLVRYAKDGNYPGAVNDAKKAISLNPELCDADMLIGDVLAAASQKFEGSSLEKAAVFWVACDYYAKARKGEDCSIDAAKKISQYSKYFPNKEEAFMENLKEGSTYHVGGWINENTKVRF